MGSFPLYSSLGQGLGDSQGLAQDPRTFGTLVECHQVSFPKLNPGTERFTLDSRFLLHRSMFACMMRLEVHEPGWEGRPQNDRQDAS